jgi:hypothetical protein
MVVVRIDRVRVGAVGVMVVALRIHSARSVIGSVVVLAVLVMVVACALVVHVGLLGRLVHADRVAARRAGGRCRIRR